MRLGAIAANGWSVTVLQSLLPQLTYDSLYARPVLDHGGWNFKPRGT